MRACSGYVLSALRGAIYLPTVKLLTALLSFIVCLTMLGGGALNLLSNGSQVVCRCDDGSLILHFQVSGFTSYMLLRLTTKSYVQLFFKPSKQFALFSFCTVSWLQEDLRAWRRRNMNRMMVLIRIGGVPTATSSRRKYFTLLLLHVASLLAALPHSGQSTHFFNSKTSSA